MKVKILKNITLYDGFGNVYGLAKGKAYEIQDYWAKQLLEAEVAEELIKEVKA